MIPYDDLVAALQNWRARQGLPVERITPTAGSGPTPVAAAIPGSGPRTAPPAPPRTNPPAPPGRAPMPMPLAAPDEDVHEHLEVEDAAMIDEQHYENEGDDFAMSFGAGGRGAPEADDSSTQIGETPDRPSGMTDPHRGGPDRDDW